MPLSSNQRAALEAKARERGVDPAKLIAEAESMLSADQSGSGNAQDAAPAEQPKLFMYLLPFVTVREVRQVWLGLSDSFPGDGEVASAWAAKQGGGSGGAPDGAPPEGQ